MTKKEHCSIVICDDNPVDTKYISDLGMGWANGRSISLQTFQSAEAFLLQYDEGKDYDILLLDIEMGKMDGITLAEFIRKDNKPVQIIFITGYPDYMSEGYEVAALHYLLKPIQKEKLFQVLDRAVENLIHQRKSMVFDTSDGHIRLYLDEVIYAEAFLHSTELKTASESYGLKEPITKLEGKLGKGFVRCHRSYIVNLRWISRLSRTEITLDNGMCLPLSRRHADEVRRCFIDYFRGIADETV